MKRALTIIVVSMFCAIASNTANAAVSSWPSSDTSGTDIGSALMTLDSSFEPSGVVWSEYANAYVVVSDEGQIVTVTGDGTVLEGWNLGSSYDLEDVTVVDPASAFIYLLDENTTTIRQFSLDTGALTGLAWSGNAVITEVDNTLGAEGLTWVPDGFGDFPAGTSGGLFYVGWQFDGDIYVFDVDLSTSGTATLLDTIETTSGYTDLSGLNFNSYTQRLYVLFDGLNILEERTASGALMASLALPSGEDQEGIAVVPSSFSAADVVIAEDGAGRVMHYAGYPAVTVDVDGDLVAAIEDCNDVDPAVSVEQSYAQDSDADGLGDANVMVSVCQATAPEGFVSDVSDSNDHDADNDGVEGETWSGTDCDDSNGSVSALVTFYADVDADGLGDLAQPSTVCALTAPAGFVANSDDVIDVVIEDVEIVNDLVDNDDDGVIDEVNDAQETGEHPYYSTLSPEESAESVVSSVRGAKRGRIVVRFSDDSEYRYSVFNTQRKKKTVVRVVPSSAYVVVKGKYKVAIVNMLTGEIVAKRKRQHDAAKLAQWVLKKTGFTLE